MLTQRERERERDRRAETTWPSSFQSDQICLYSNNIEFCFKPICRCETCELYLFIKENVESIAKLDATFVNIIIIIIIVAGVVA